MGNQISVRERRARKMTGNVIFGPRGGAAGPMDEENMALFRHTPRKPLTFWETLRGTLFWPSKRLASLIGISLLVQTAVVITWRFLIEPKYGQVSIDPFLSQMIVFIVSLMISRSIYEGVGMYRDTKLQWDEMLSSLQIAGFKIAISFSTDAVVSFEDKSQLSLSVQLAVQIRDILIALPYASMLYFEDQLDIEAIYVDDETKAEIQAQTVYREDGTHVGSMVDAIIYVLMRKYIRLVRIKAMEFLGPDALTPTIEKISKINSLRKFKMLPIFSYQLQFVVIIFLLSVSITFWSLYRWNSLWIFPIFVHVFYGLVVASTLTENPFGDPSDDPVVAKLRIREEADETAASIYMAFQTSVFQILRDKDALYTQEYTQSVMKYHPEFLRVSGMVPTNYNI